MATIDKVACLSCEAIDKFGTMAGDFAGNMSDALSGPVFKLFMAVFILWVAVSGYKIILKPGQSVWGDIIQEGFFIFMSFTLIAAPYNTLILSAYEGTLSVMAGAAQAAFAVAAPPALADTSGYEGMAGLMAAVERAIKYVFGIAVSMVNKGSALNPMNYFYAIVLIVPYALLFFMYFAQVVVAMFRVMMVAMFSPFLVMAFGFNWGRPMAVAGLRTALSAVMVLFACTAAAGIAIFGVAQLDLENIVDREGVEAIKDMASLDNVDFILAVLLGLLGAAFMTEAISIANSITGSMLTNTAADVITGGMSAAALGAWKFSNPFTAGGRITGAAQGVRDQGVAWGTIADNTGISAAGQKVLNKFHAVQNGTAESAAGGSGR